MPAAVPSTQSSRVWLTISMIVRIPRPGSPTSRAQVPSSSISAEAFERSPSLSFSRWMRKTLRSPSGSTRGTWKHESPSSVCPRTRNRSDIGAEQNHLCPVSACSSPLSRTATVRFARTSDPPCRSVIAMPAIAPVFSPASTRRGSYSLDVSRGSQAAASPAWARSAGTAAYVIDMGHACPGSTWLNSSKSAPRATWAPGFGSRQAWAPKRRPQPRGGRSRGRRGRSGPRRSGCRTGRASRAPVGGGSPALPRPERPPSPRAGPPHGAGRLPRRSIASASGGLSTYSSSPTRGGVWFSGASRGSCPRSRP